MVSTPKWISMLVFFMDSTSYGRAVDVNPIDFRFHEFIERRTTVAVGVPTGTSPTGEVPRQNSTKNNNIIIHIGALTASAHYAMCKDAQSHNSIFVYQHFCE